MRGFKPLEHQWMIIDHVVARKRSMVQAGMGLGKTGALLYSMNELFFLGAITGVLILAPKNVCILTWPDEIEKWACGFKVARLWTPEGIQAWKDGSADVYILNYDRVTKFFTQHCNQKVLPANMVLMDESDSFKTGSGRTDTMVKYAHHFDYRVAMTGTPMPNGYIDLFPQARILDDGKALGKFVTHYREDYFFNPDRRGFSWKLRRGAKAIIDQKMSKMTITLRSEDWLKVPEMVIEDVVLKLPKEARKHYAELEESFLTQIHDSDVPAETASVLCTKLQQITSGWVYDEDRAVHHVHDVKIDALKDIIKKLKGSPVLIACCFVHEREAIIRGLESLGGEEFSHDRMAAWNAGKIPVWIAHWKNISHGLNLQKGGQEIVWVSLPYSQAGFSQFNARLHRQGQDKRVRVRRLICKDTIDEAVAAVLRSKAATQDKYMAAVSALEKLRKFR